MYLVAASSKTLLANFQLVAENDCQICPFGKRSVQVVRDSSKVDVITDWLSCVGLDQKGMRVQGRTL